MAEVEQVINKPIKLIKLSKVMKTEDKNEEHIICDCGTTILARRQKQHNSHYKHKYLTGQISKDEYDVYDTKYRTRYKNLPDEKREILKTKSREYQRERSLVTGGSYYAAKRLDMIICPCGAKINRTYSKAHATSQKHIHGMAGTVPPKRTLIRKPKKDIMAEMQAMIE